MWTLREGVLYGPESWLWMICEEDVCWVVEIPPTCSFFGMFLLVQVEMVYLANRCLVSFMHYEEILDYKHNMICNIIPFASLRSQKRWVNVRWFLGPQQWFIKNSNRTTQNGVSPFPISLLLIASHFLSDTNMMLALFVNGLMWPFSMMETFSDSGGIFTSMAVLENIHILWNWQSQSFSRLLEDKVRGLLSDRGGCWTCVLIVGTRFCYQRSHFYSYRYCCPEIKFRLTQSTYNVVWW